MSYTSWLVGGSVLVLRGSPMLGDDGGQVVGPRMDCPAQSLSGAPFADDRCTTPSRQPQPQRIRANLGTRIHFLL